MHTNTDANRTNLFFAKRLLLDALGLGAAFWGLSYAFGMHHRPALQTPDRPKAHGVWSGLFCSHTYMTGNTALKDGATFTPSSCFLFHSNHCSMINSRLRRFHYDTRIASFFFFFFAIHFPLSSSAAIASACGAGADAVWVCCILTRQNDPFRDHERRRCGLQDMCFFPLFFLLLI